MAQKNQPADRSNKSVDHSAKKPRKILEEPSHDDSKSGAGGGPTELLKTWSDTILSTAKAATLLIGVTLVIWLAWTIVGVDRKQRQVSFEIDSKIENLFLELGVDFDLRSTVGDETNSRINAVRSFLEKTLFKSIAFSSSQPISFKPFGVDMQSTDVAGVARLLLGGEPAFRVRFELLCDPGPCDVPRAVGAQRPAQRPAERLKRLTLIANLSGAERGERLVFPLSIKPAALRRALRIATQRTAEKLLELADPMIASVLYNNLPGTVGFADEARRYAVLAASVAHQVRREASDRVCLSEIVLGDAMIQRGDLAGGIKKLEEVAEESRLAHGNSRSISARNIARMCRIQAKTDQAIFQLRYLCSAAGSVKPKVLEDIPTEMQELLKFAKHGSKQEQQRVRDLFVQSRFRTNLFYGDSAALSAFCKGSRENSDLAIGSPSRERAYLALKELRRILPPNELQTAAADVINILVDYIGVAMPRTDFIGRLDLLTTASEMLDQYTSRSPSPRELYFVRGRIFNEIGRIVRDVVRSADESVQRTFIIRWRGSPKDAPPVPADKIQTALQDELVSALWDARIAFENASSVESPYYLFEGLSKLDALRLLGDHYYSDPSGKTYVAEAEKAYASALRLFIEQDAPLRHFQSIVKTAARWMIVRHRAGACAKSGRDAAWDEVWTLLGAASDHDWCLMMVSEQPIATEKLGILGILSPYLRDIAKKCPDKRAITTAPAAIYERFDLIRCIEDADIEVSGKFFSSRDGADFDRLIGQALDAH